MSLQDAAPRHGERDHKTKPTKKCRKLTRAERKKRDKRRAKREAAREAERARLQNLNPNQVLTFKQWIVLNGISDATGRRILKSDNGPKVIQLSSQRIGIRVDDNADWQESLTRDGE
jgi:hypothetical protein